MNKQEEKIILYTKDFFKATSWFFIILIVIISFLESELALIFTIPIVMVYILCSDQKGEIRGDLKLTILENGRVFAYHVDELTGEIRKYRILKIYYLKTFRISPSLKLVQNVIGRKFSLTDIRCLFYYPAFFISVWITILLTSFFLVLLNLTRRLIFNEEKRVLLFLIAREDDISISNISEGELIFPCVIKKSDFQEFPVNHISKIFICL